MATYEELVADVAQLREQEGELLGTWVYGDKQTEYRILPGLRFEGPHKVHKTVSGTLGPRAGWLQADLRSPKGEPAGSIRVRLNPEEGTMTSKYKGAGKTDWGSAVVAHRKPPEPPLAPRTGRASVKDFIVKKKAQEVVQAQEAAAAGAAEEESSGSEVEDVPDHLRVCIEEDDKVKRAWDRLMVATGRSAPKWPAREEVQRRGRGAPSARPGLAGKAADARARPAEAQTARGPAFEPPERPRPAAGVVTPPVVTPPVIKDNESTRGGATASKMAAPPVVADGVISGLNAVCRLIEEKKLLAVMHRSGVRVREGVSLDSQDLGRYPDLTILERLDQDGARLHVRKCEGSGPDEGWVTAKIAGKAVFSLIRSLKEMREIQDAAILKSSKWY